MYDVKGELWSESQLLEIISVGFCQQDCEYGVCMDTQVGGFCFCEEGYWGDTCSHRQGLLSAGVPWKIFLLAIGILVGYLLGRLTPRRTTIDTDFEAKVETANTNVRTGNNKINWSCTGQKKRKK